MSIPTESIGSIPRPPQLLEALSLFQSGHLAAAQLDSIYQAALQDTITRLEQTGSPVLTDGEQMKPSFATYPLSGLTNLASDGVVIPFADGPSAAVAAAYGWPVPVWSACGELYVGGEGLYAETG